MNESCHTVDIHVRLCVLIYGLTYMNESCHTYAEVMLHI